MRLPRRLGMFLALAGILGFVYLLQQYLAGFKSLHRPAALEPIAHSGAQAIAFTADGGTLVSVDPVHLRRWSVASGRYQEQSLTGRGMYRDDLAHIRLSRKAELMAGSTGDSVYALALDGSAGTWHLPALIWGAPSADGRLVYGYTLGGWEAIVFDVAGRKPVAALRAPRDRPWIGLSLSDDRRWLSGITADGSAWAWPLAHKDSAPLRLHTAHPASLTDPEPVRSLELAPDGGALAISGAEHFGLIPAAERDLRLVGSEAAGAQTPRFSPDGTLLAVAESRQRTYAVGSLGIEQRQESVWVPVTYPLTSEAISIEPAGHVPEYGHHDRIADIAWSPDQQTLATLDEAGRIALWDLHAARLLRFLKGN